MEVRLQKWGNPNGIEIPNIILKTFNLKPNDKVNIRHEDEQIEVKERSYIFRRKNKSI